MMRSRPGTFGVMSQVVLATLPGLAVLLWLFGPAVLLTVLLAVAGALAADALALWLRDRSLKTGLGDGSAVVTGLLLGLALPPFLPAWMTLLGAALAILLGKQVYGGLGQNPFNPAMVGYAILLVSFPLEMTTWALPRGLADVEPAGLMEAARLILAGSADVPDALTGATPLDHFKHRESLTVAEWQAASGLAGRFAGAGWESVNLAFLAGGLYLMLVRRLFSWHAPVGMLTALGVCAVLFWDGGSSSSGGSPLFHLLGGATMLAAFFIVTDPVSGATSPRGRLLFGIGVGVLIYMIRAFGGYPDAVAFAVLLMNAAAPFIDHFTRPRVYGHGRERSA
ncbi:MAG: RnfABCDGE type electron transport complex subunit D [Gammaproteobacteria bacterium]|nr:MAG: RnfABCDGE type electron transport complex subunit D [Gammaproteobacteria bacterium]